MTCQHNRTGYLFSGFRVDEAGDTWGQCFYCGEEVNLSKAEREGRIQIGGELKEVSEG